MHKLGSVGHGFLGLGVSLALLTACGGDSKPVLGPKPAACPALAAAPAAPPSPGPAGSGSGKSAADRGQGALLLEGTPEIPAALRRRVARYLATRSAQLMDLADNGRSLLVATRFGQTSQLHRVLRPGGARSQITFGTEPIGAARFEPGGRAVHYLADAGGNEKRQIVRMQLDNGETTMLTDGKSRNGELLWSRDGKRAAYRSTARNGVDWDIWISDGRTPSSAKMIAKGQGAWYPLAWSFDGKKLLVGQYVSISDSRIHVVDLVSGAVTRLSPEPAAAYWDAVFSSDGKKVYLTSNREGEFAELYVTDSAGKTWRSLTRSIPWNVGGLALSRTGRYLAFTTNEGGISVVHLLDTRTDRAKVVRLPKGVISGLRFARKADVLGFSMSSATSTGDSYTYELRTKKLVRWTQSELGGLDPKALVEPSLVEYKSFDGAKIPAFYYRPKGDGPFPVVVAIHGGPESQARPRFSAFTQYMVSELGYAVLYPNVRGSTGYGKSYTLLDNGMRREDSVKDIGSLLDWIADRKELDAKRVGVIGGSYGGYMVLASLVHFSDRIRAGVDIVGISNFVTFLQNTGDYRRNLRRAEYGDERNPAMKKYLLSISPANHADKIASALFVAQGANDPRVPATEAEQIVKAVRKQGKPVWYMLARNEGHGFAKKANSDTFLLLSILFFQQNL